MDLDDWQDTAFGRGEAGVNALHGLTIDFRMNAQGNAAVNQIYFDSSAQERHLLSIADLADNNAQITLVALWEPIVYRVEYAASTGGNYSLGGGEFVDDLNNNRAFTHFVFGTRMDLPVVRNSTATTRSDSQVWRNGWTFNGWFEQNRRQMDTVGRRDNIQEIDQWNREGQRNVAYQGNYVITEIPDDHTFRLYGRWTSNELTITYNFNIPSEAGASLRSGGGTGSNEVAGGNFDRFHRSYETGNINFVATDATLFGLTGYTQVAWMKSGDGWTDATDAQRRWNRMEDAYGFNFERQMSAIVLHTPQTLTNNHINGVIVCGRHSNENTGTWCTGTETDCGLWMTRTHYNITLSAVWSANRMHMSFSGGNKLDRGEFDCRFIYGVNDAHLDTDRQIGVTNYDQVRSTLTGEAPKPSFVLDFGMSNFHMVNDARIAMGAFERPGFEQVGWYIFDNRGQFGFVNMQQGATNATGHTIAVGDAIPFDWGLANRETNRTAYIADVAQTRERRHEANWVTDEYYHRIPGGSSPTRGTWLPAASDTDRRWVSRADMTNLSVLVEDIFGSNAEILSGDLAVHFVPMWQAKTYELRFYETFEYEELVGTAMQPRFRRAALNTTVNGVPNTGYAISPTTNAPALTNSATSPVLHPRRRHSNANVRSFQFNRNINIQVPLKPGSDFLGWHFCVYRTYSGDTSTYIPRDGTRVAATVNDRSPYTRRWTVLSADSFYTFGIGAGRGEHSSPLPDTRVNAVDDGTDHDISLWDLPSLVFQRWITSRNAEINEDTRIINMYAEFANSEFSINFRDHAIAFLEEDQCATCGLGNICQFGANLHVLPLTGGGHGGNAIQVCYAEEWGMIRYRGTSLGERNFTGSGFMTRAGTGAGTEQYLFTVERGSTVPPHAPGVTMPGATTPCVHTRFTGLNGTIPTGTNNPFNMSGLTFDGALARLRTAYGQWVESPNPPIGAVNALSGRPWHVYGEETRIPIPQVDWNRYVYDRYGRQQMNPQTNPQTRHTLGTLPGMRLPREGGGYRFRFIGWQTSNGTPLVERCSTHDANLASCTAACVRNGLRYAIIPADYPMNAEADDITIVARWGSEFNINLIGLRGQALPYGFDQMRGPDEEVYIPALQNITGDQPMTFMGWAYVPEEYVRHYPDGTGAFDINRLSAPVVDGHMHIHNRPPPPDAPPGTPSGASHFPPDRRHINRDMTFIARWAPSQFTLTFHCELSRSSPLVAANAGALTGVLETFYERGGVTPTTNLVNTFDFATVGLWDINAHNIPRFNFVGWEVMLPNCTATCPNPCPTPNEHASNSAPVSNVTLAGGDRHLFTRWTVNPAPLQEILDRLKRANLLALYTTNYEAFKDLITAMENAQDFINNDMGQVYTSKREFNADGTVEIITDPATTGTLMNRLNLRHTALVNEVAALANVVNSMPINLRDVGASMNTALLAYLRDLARDYHGATHLHQFFVNDPAPSPSVVSQLNMLHSDFANLFHRMTSANVNLGTFWEKIRYERAFFNLMLEQSGSGHIFATTEDGIREMSAPPSVRRDFHRLLAILNEQPLSGTETAAAIFHINMELAPRNLVQVIDCPESTTGILLGLWNRIVAAAEFDGREFLAPDANGIRWPRSMPAVDAEIVRAHEWLSTLHEYAVWGEHNTEAWVHNATNGQSLHIAILPSINHSRMATINSLISMINRDNLTRVDLLDMKLELRALNVQMESAIRANVQLSWLADQFVNSYNTNYPIPSLPMFVGTRAMLEYSRGVMETYLPWADLNLAPQRGRIPGGFHVRGQIVTAINNLNAVIDATAQQAPTNRGARVALNTSVAATSYLGKPYRTTHEGLRVPAIMGLTNATLSDFNNILMTLREWEAYNDIANLDIVISRFTYLYTASTEQQGRYRTQRLINQIVAMPAISLDATGRPIPFHNTDEARAVLRQHVDILHDAMDNLRACTKDRPTGWRSIETLLGIAQDLLDESDEVLVNAFATRGVINDLVNRIRLFLGNYDVDHPMDAGGNFLPNDNSFLIEQVGFMREMLEEYTGPLGGFQGNAAALNMLRTQIEFLTSVENNRFATNAAIRRAMTQVQEELGFIIFIERNGVLFPMPAGGQSVQLRVLVERIEDVQAYIDEMPDTALRSALQSQANSALLIAQLASAGGTEHGLFDIWFARRTLNNFLVENGIDIPERMPCDDENGYDEIPRLTGGDGFVIAIIVACVVLGCIAVLSIPTFRYAKKHDIKFTQVIPHAFGNKGKNKKHVVEEGHAVPHNPEINQEISE